MTVEGAPSVTRTCASSTRTGSFDGVTVNFSVVVPVSAGFCASLTRTLSQPDAAVFPRSTSVASRRNWFSQACAASALPEKRRPSGSLVTTPAVMPPGSANVARAGSLSVTSRLSPDAASPSWSIVQPERVAMLAPSALSVLGSMSSSAAMVVETVGTPSSGASRASQAAAKPATVSTGPLRYSRTQLPPRASDPVASVEAATSACVSRAILSTSCRPPSPAPLEQP